MPPKRKGAVAHLEWTDVETRHPDLCLEYVTNEDRRSVVLHGGAAYLGRNTHLRAPFVEQEVSQTHALVELDTKRRQWKVKDMDSSHGTAVNGKAVSSKRATYLKDGDKIVLSEQVEVLVNVQQPDAGCTVREMLDRYAAVQVDMANFELEAKIVGQVEDWEDCRDKLAEVIGEDDEEE